MYLKDDMVIREGEVSREMYFIKSGAIQVHLPQLSPSLQCCGRCPGGACAVACIARKCIFLWDTLSANVPGRVALPIGCTPSYGCTPS